MLILHYISKYLNLEAEKLDTCSIYSGTWNERIHYLVKQRLKNNKGLEIQRTSQNRLFLKKSRIQAFITLRSWNQVKHSHNMCLELTPKVTSAEWIMMTPVSPKKRDPCIRSWLSPLRILRLIQLSGHGILCPAHRYQFIYHKRNHFRVFSI